MRALMLVLFSLLSSGALAAEVKVVATLPDLAAVAKEVGGEHVSVTAMALPTQDPHFVDAKPNLALAVSRADALLLVGLDMEVGWLPTLLTASRNARIQPGTPGYIDCSRFVQILGKPSGVVDRSMGDLHGGGNPHYFYDPRAMVAVARGVAGQLGAVDPAHAEDYTANAEAFVTELEGRIRDWKGRLAGIEGTPVLQYHRSWLYLQDWLGFEVVADIEPKPGIPPTPAHVAKTVIAGRSRGVKLVLVEGFYPHKTVDIVAEKAGAKMVTLRAGTDFTGGQTYIEHIDEWVEAMATALEAG